MLFLHVCITTCACLVPMEVKKNGSKRFPGTAEPPLQPLCDFLLISYIIVLFYIILNGLYFFIWWCISKLGKMRMVVKYLRVILEVSHDFGKGGLKSFRRVQWTILIFIYFAIYCSENSFKKIENHSLVLESILWALNKKNLRNSVSQSSMFRITRQFPWPGWSQPKKLSHIKPIRVGFRVNPQNQSRQMCVWSEEGLL